MEALIGREEEIRELSRCMNSKRSEFVVLYGRRRIGKTFLVNSFFGNSFFLSFTGSHRAGKARQLEMFAYTLQECGKLKSKPMVDNWFHAFDTLKTLLKKKKTKTKHVIFFDEMPWIDRSRSDFLTALEDFWNGWAAQQGNIVLVATGSATSWMVNNLLKNQGGLYNRVTSKIHLRPFTLKECESYLRHHKCHWDRYAITQYYMYLGGVPYYLSLLDYDKSLEENVFKLFFSVNSRLENEFDDLYAVLFKNHEKYIDIVRLLAQNRQGLSHSEIAEKTSSGGGLTKMLQNLMRCDFIMAYKHYGRKQRDTIYRLTDFFTLFYLHFVENAGIQTNMNYWNQMLAKQQVKVWQGLTFELVGLMHVEQIKRSLGISGILTEQSTWRSSSEQEVENGKKRRAQIDLVIERSDRQIHLCEMKFSQELFVIDKNYEQNLREKMTVFRMETKTKKALLTTFVTTYGIKNNTHAGIVASQVMMDDLFM